MATICKYCNEAENKQDRPGLICESCICFIHLGCLCRLGTPGNLACDVFFDFTCLDCSPEKKEVLKRNKFPWVNVIYLTLHHLSIHSYGIGNHGFFHYKTHICSFIDRNWGILFGPQFKQKKNWVGTIAGALSVHNNVLFRSGSIALGESGWWKLQHGFSPAVAAHILQELAREKPKGRVRNQLAMDKHSFIRRVTELGYKDLLGDDSENVPIAGLEPSAKKRRLEVDAVSGISGAPYLDYVVDIKSEPAAEEAAGGDAGSLALQLGPACGDLEAAFRGFDFPTTSQDLPPPSDSSSPSHQHSTANFDSDSRSRSPPAEPHAEPPERQADLRRARKEDKPVAVRETLFSRQLNSVDMPWVTKKEEDTEKRKTGKELVEMSQYEEVQLLKRVQQLTSRVRNPNRKAELRRFRAKLALRRLKRHKHVPLFDLDRAVKLLGGYISEGPKAVVDSERVLDRFQRSYLMDSLSGTVSQSRSGPVLLSRCEARPTQSPHSGCLLKPYVRRDLSSRPMWLALTEELLAKANRKNPKFVAPPRGSIDYSYVRPQHIAAVNSLCAQHFWPGIDVSEALQYPEFSCVVTYKKIVIGFAFLVPDVAHNQAYISFLLTRPEWRRAGIATFMLYHLLQTCTGKDVTLHVSPTNSAIFLYQRFGFKVEEFIQDFYEKYYDIDYKGCRHALLLRLAR